MFATKRTAQTKDHPPLQGARSSSWAEYRTGALAVCNPTAISFVCDLCPCFCCFPSCRWQCSPTPAPADNKSSVAIFSKAVPECKFIWLCSLQLLLFALDPVFPLKIYWVFLFPSQVLDFCPIQRQRCKAGTRRSEQFNYSTNPSRARKERQVIKSPWGYSTLGKPLWGARNACKCWSHSHYPIPFLGLSRSQLHPFVCHVLHWITP